MNDQPKSAPTTSVPVARLNVTVFDVSDRSSTWAGAPAAVMVACVTPSAPGVSVQLPSIVSASATVAGVSDTSTSGTSSDTDRFTVPVALSPSWSDAITVIEPSARVSSWVASGWLS